MAIRIGIDVGAVTLKAALRVTPDVLDRLDVNALSDVQALPTPSDDDRLFGLAPRRTRGRPVDCAREFLESLRSVIPDELNLQLALTGSAGRSVAETFSAPVCNEFQACALAMGRLYPKVRTVFELGGETSRYLRLEPDPVSGELGILDYGTNGDCAAGTGSFLDQQAARLNYAVEDISAIVAEADRAAQIAGRCSVFAKSDMIHAQQKGFGPAEVLRGLCDAVAGNFKMAVAKGRVPVTPIALIGGVAANGAIVAAVRRTFGLGEEDLFVPDAPAGLLAVGAVLCEPLNAQTPMPLPVLTRRLAGAMQRNGHTFPRMPALGLDNVVLLRDGVKPYNFDDADTPVDAYLGLDIGSVGTKLVLIDDQGRVIHSIFTRTEGRPIEVVTRCLREMEEAVGWAVRICGVGTTGSGRELIGELVGADTINDEITAHKTGAAFIGRRLLGKVPDTIFEIGGQDSKYISLETPDENAGTEPVVVDFTMNEACAAGTGSFLEERAGELGVSIRGEFSELALQSTSPLKLGERCTVFMERDVNTYVQRGAQRADIVAGLAYSIALNYINRVVRGRPIGSCVFFQGGTAYNDAVAAAFSMITGKEIIVPPHNAVLGAIGAARLACEKMQATGSASRFRGYDLAQVDYTLREFTCHGCGNHCAIQEFNVAGEKTFWGDKCSDRYRKAARSERKPVIPDLAALRHQLLHEDAIDDPSNPIATIGIPLAMYTWDFLPLWRRFLRDCGFRVVLSRETHRGTIRRGQDHVVAEPCFPIIVAHGHVIELIEQGVDHVWLPNLLTSGPKAGHLNAYVCPWGSTLPFIVRQIPAVRKWSGRILCPRISFQEGAASVERELIRTVAELGVRRSVARRAFAAGMARLDAFRSAYEQAGRAALNTLCRTGEPGMILAGRPYNTYDGGVSLAVARKLREHYGVNVVPVDALPTHEIDIGDIAENMYWAYGRRILAAGRLVRQHPNLHIIYLTNFKCGPDSFLKGFVRPASSKPFLTLQFDGHSNDAGMMTRCEAYLDSKGILRWWRTCKSKPVDEVLPAEDSTSPKWRTPVLG